MSGTQIASSQLPYAGGAARKLLRWRIIETCVGICVFLGLMILIFICLWYVGSIYDVIISGVSNINAILNLSRLRLANST